jgi:hypothetical protein
MSKKITKITICGSMSAARKMYEVYRILTDKGYQVFLPEFVIEYIDGNLGWELGTLPPEEGADKKKSHDLIRKHYYKIQESNAILVVNEEKNGIKNYIGANTLIEMAFAYVLNKKIYLLNGIPDFEYLLEEVKAMEPIILNGNLNKIQ